MLPTAVYERPGPVPPKIHPLQSMCSQPSAAAFQPAARAQALQAGSSSRRRLFQCHLIQNFGDLQLQSSGGTLVEFLLPDAPFAAALIHFRRGRHPRPQTQLVRCCLADGARFGSGLKQLHGIGKGRGDLIVLQSFRSLLVFLTCVGGGGFL